MPDELKPPWDEWSKLLVEVECLKLPRPYAPLLDHAKCVELHIFCDALTKSIAAVAYLKITQHDDQIPVSFVFGKAKLAPAWATTIPQLQLCAAVLAVKITDAILREHVCSAKSDNLLLGQQSCPSLYHQPDHKVLCVRQQQN